jgi:AcrR family transcriptional regulator
METIPPVIPYYPLPAAAEAVPDRHALDANPVQSPTARQSRRDADRDRQRILETAQEVLAVYGLDVTLEDIARFAGLSLRTVRRCFATRDALIHTLFDRALTELAQAAEDAAEHPDPLLGFLGFLTESAQTQARNCGLRTLLLSETTGPLAAEQARARLMPGLTKLVERARENGVVPAEMEPADLPTLQFVLSNVTEYAENIEPELWQRYLAILLDGLQVPPHAALDCAPAADRLPELT